MEQRRINANYPKEHLPDSDENSVRSKRLGLYFDAALNNKEVYQTDDEIEQQFDNLLDDLIPTSRRLCFFIGNKKTGKTTFLKQKFSIERNSPVIRDGCMYLPVMGSGDVIKKEPYDKAADNMKALCDLLENEYPAIKENISDQWIDDFYQFILDTRAEYLPELSFSEECSRTIHECKCAKIDKMQQQNKLVYYLTKYKFYLYKFCPDLKRLIIILDDIQGIYDHDEKKKEELMEIFLKIYECLGEYRILGDRNLQVFLIITVRPYDYRIFKSNPNVQKHLPLVIWNTKKLNSVELVKKMAEKYLEPVITVDSKYANPESASYREDLSVLSQKFKCKYSDMIEKLCLYDLTLIIKAYKRILLNDTWVQEGKFRFTSEKQQESGVSFTNITCIRALACGNEKVYYRWDNLQNMSSLDKLIPNILYNYIEDEDGHVEDYAVLNLLTMKYYLRRYDPNMEVGDKFVIMKDFIDCTRQLLDMDEDFIKSSTEYLLERKILRRSFHDDIQSKAEYRLDINSKLYITPRGRKLWDMFKDDSVLLEICREDRYFNYDGPADKWKSSYDLMMEGKQKDLFLQLLELIEDLYSKELQYYERACKKQMRQQYFDAFGKSPVTVILLEGVMNSMRYAGSNDILEKGDKLKDNMYSNWKATGDKYV